MSRGGCATVCCARWDARISSRRRANWSDLAGSFARLDPPLVGVRREVGPLLLASHFLGELGVAGAIDAALPQHGRSQLSVGEAVCVLVASRLCSPSPLYDVAGWASGAAVHELLGIPAQLLNDDRLGRALEIFAVYAEHLRGLLAARAIERFGVDAGRLHVDLTTVRVTGAYEDSALVAKGWGADRRVERQVRTLQATSHDGVALYLRPDPGNSAELTLVGQSLQRLLALSKPGMLIVCNSVCGQPKTLREIACAGLEFIVALRANTGFKERFLADVGHSALRPLRYVAERERELPAARRTRYRGALRDWELTDPQTGEHLGLRVVYIHSSEEASEVAVAPTSLPAVHPAAAAEHTDPRPGKPGSPGRLAHGPRTSMARRAQSRPGGWRPGCPAPAGRPR